jgi:cbb3-type cytochrome oxidase maturation protein
LIAFLWSVKSGQYSDTYTPSVRMLFEDEKSKKEKETEEQTKIKEEKKT